MGIRRYIAEGERARRAGDEGFVDILKTIGIDAVQSWTGEWKITYSKTVPGWTERRAEESATKITEEELTRLHTDIFEVGQRKMKWLEKFFEGKLDESFE